MNRRQERMIRRELAELRRTVRELTRLTGQAAGEVAWLVEGEISRSVERGSGGRDQGDVQADMDTAARIMRAAFGSAPELWKVDQEPKAPAPEPDRPPRACRPRARDAYLAPVKRRRNRPPRLPKHGGEAA